ncbi:CheR family methyltransferase [Pseudomonas sp. JS3066]|jgi:chemotaxis protein methyltransferase WspC|uniref:CheR family methyltransferase n=1 Tax=unclassified Pseudomonas TaxID=196821 RepID=UPI00129EF4D2|nr:MULTISPECIES: CheR family methyltransferase [unclassified Pseudomonas]MDH4652990.1 chemotaxis protein CheR [Pseudomonas sp. BN606]MRK22765.1 chemotaxis protein CheR [Pseudomonas sp. JG-B]WVK92054.1 CheR family methyltransferase [Pseudomonas sp. JS3066]
MIERFEALLKSRIGLEAESVGRVVIERALRQRMSACGSRDEEAYWATLNASPAEQQALVEAVVVPETWFFRYPESFAALGRLAFERLPTLAGGRPLRILSLPCSTGEEPFSIVMALLDAGLAPGLFQVDAVDISERVLERARQGLYGRNSFRGEDLGFRDRYFIPSGESYVLAQQVASKVRFLRGNLLDPGLLSGEPPYDFVFCRNLLIYFDRTTQIAVLEVLKRHMLKDGAMFIGPAEANLLSQQGMQPLGYPQAFVFRNAPPQAAAKPAKARAPAPTPVVTAPLPSRAPARPRAMLPKPELPRAKADGVGPDAALAAIASLANSGRTEEARVACEAFLSAHGPSADVFYWLGLLSDVAGKSDEAQDHYRKALYLAPQHAEALAHLAALLAARGDRAGAERLLQRASRGVNSHGR